VVYTDDVNIFGRNPTYYIGNCSSLLVASMEIGIEVNADKTKNMIKS
jgi:hypothetical protein